MPRQVQHEIKNGLDNHVQYCANCKHWVRIHAPDNFGFCDEIVNDVIPVYEESGMPDLESEAIPLEEKTHLITRRSFVCPRWKLFLIPF